MTIYTPSVADKKPAQDADEPEVVTEPLTGEKKEKEALEAVIINNHYNDGRAIILRARRRSAFMHMLLALIILGVLALGAIGSVVLYRHLNKKVYSGRCGNEFFDVTYHDALEGRQDNIPVDYVDEDILICEAENYEEMHTGRFDEVSETYVIHDFMVNYTVLIDHEKRRCYITAIRSNILQPGDFVFQIQERSPFGTVRRTVVFREDYVMVIPDHYSRSFGKRIVDACFHYDTYKLEPYVTGVVKRDVSGVSQKQGLGKMAGTYAIFTNDMTHQQLYKIRVYEPMQLA